MSEIENHILDVLDANPQGLGHEKLARQVKAVANVQASTINIAINSLDRARRIRKQADGRYIASRDRTPDVAEAPPPTREAQIIAAFAATPLMTIDEIADALTVDRSTAHAVLKRMVTKGTVVNSGHRQETEGAGRAPILYKLAEAVAVEDDETAIAEAPAATAESTTPVVLEDNAEVFEASHHEPMEPAPQRTDPLKDIPTLHDAAREVAPSKSAREEAFQTEDGAKHEACQQKAALCSACLSAEVVAHADAIWNFATQRWDFSAVRRDDDGSLLGHCARCDFSCDIEMVDAPLLNDEVELTILKLRRACGPAGEARLRKQVLEEVTQLMSRLGERTAAA